MKYNISYSLFVVLFLLLMCCISGYAENRAQQEVNGGVNGEPRPPSYEEKIMPGHEQLEQQSKPTKEKETLSRQFYGSHVVEFVKSELVGIYTAGVEQWLTEKSEFIGFLSQDMNSNGVWNKVHVKKFGPNTDQYVDNLKKYKPHGEHQAVVALVESNNPQIQENSVLRIVWMTTLNDETKKYSLSYTSFNFKFPFTNGTAGVMQFRFNESTPILRMKKGTFVFPVQFNADNNEPMSTVMYYTPHNKKWNIGGLIDEGAYNPTILEWKEGNLMMITQHEICQRVYESTDLGKTWKESTSTLSRVWARSPIRYGRGSQNSFITETINGKDIILFMQTVDSHEAIELHLWLTDKTHIYRVGLIDKGREWNPCTLIFKYKKLYCLNERTEEDFGFLSVDLTTKMEEIKKVLTKWTEQDKILSGNDCTSSGQCKYPLPTSGLVGYLSGKSDENGKWNDEYHCMNAVLNGTTKKVPNGFLFNGVGAGAEWPVSNGGPAREYYFTNYAFTLAATVTIHAVPEKESSPLLGVKLTNPDRSILLGVSYKNDNTWSTTSKGKEAKAEIPKWEVGKEYSVILTFEDGKGYVYINGTRVDVGTGLKIAEEEEISHFYFGAYSKDMFQSETEEVKANVHITVKDVLLYNRGLLPTEIEALVKNKANVFLSKKAAKKVSEQTTATSTTTSTSTATSTASPQTSTTSTATGPTPTDGTTSGSQPTKITENTNSGGEVNSLITVQLANSHQNTTDGIFRVYGYGLPLLLLGVWVFATVLP